MGASAPSTKERVMKVEILVMEGEDSQVAVNLPRELCGDVSDEKYFNGPSGFMLDLDEWNGMGLVFDADRLIEDPVEPEVYTCVGDMDEGIAEQWKRAFETWCKMSFDEPDSDDAMRWAFKLLGPVEKSLGLSKGVLLEMLEEIARVDALRQIDDDMLANAI